MHSRTCSQRNLQELQRLWQLRTAVEVGCDRWENCDDENDVLRDAHEGDEVGWWRRRFHQSPRGAGESDGDGGSVDVGAYCRSARGKPAEGAGAEWSAPDETSSTLPEAETHRCWGEADDTHRAAFAAADAVAGWSSVASAHHDVDSDDGGGHLDLAYPWRGLAGASSCCCTVAVVADTAAEVLARQPRSYSSDGDLRLRIPRQG